MVARSAGELLNSVAIPVTLTIFPSDELFFVDPVKVDSPFGGKTGDDLGGFVEVNFQLVRPDWRSLRIGKQDQGQENNHNFWYSYIFSETRIHIKISRHVENWRLMRLINSILKCGWLTRSPYLLLQEDKGRWSDWLHHLHLRLHAQREDYCLLSLDSCLSHCVFDWLRLFDLIADKQWLLFNGLLNCRVGSNQSLWFFIFCTFLFKELSKLLQLRLRWSGNWRRYSCDWASNWSSWDWLWLLNLLDVDSTN